MDSPRLAKMSPWFKCKQFFQNFSKNRKGNKIRSFPPNDCSTSQSLEVAEDIGNENRSSGLFMCWRRRRSNNKRSSTSNSESCEESDNANRDSASLMTWTDPVVYLSNSRPSARRSRCFVICISNLVRPIFLGHYQPFRERQCRETQNLYCR